MIKKLNNRIFKIAFIILSSTIILFGASCSEKDNSYDENSQISDEILSSNELYSEDNSTLSENLSENQSNILSNENIETSDKSNAYESDILTESNYSESSESSESYESFENYESFEEPESSFNSQNSEDNYSSDDSNAIKNKTFSEPIGIEYTTSKGNVFITNCKDEKVLNIMVEIADTASEYNKTTVYYTDVEQKYFFAYNVNLTHNTASTIKAPYAAYILQSGADLTEVLVMEKRHIFTGSGVLKNKEVGSRFTVSELIRYMITRSDNTAYAMLLERFGTQGFREYAKKLEVDFKLPSGGYTTCKIREMAAFLLDIYNYQETERGKTLIKHMKNCSYSLQIPKAVSYDVAHKFGFIYEGKAFHDMGIVYAPSPYLELIFTRINGSVYDTKAFIQIGKLVEKLNMELSEEY
ncbi:MAG: serine hydrolase [Clostridia bacterium]|nr:serine hydrolase [Clostridia bacterium]